ncbi:MAG TPA: DUF2383 domain-containing protein [Cytophagaceae bacterium]|jgi:uncharacterized protein (TIGR02284 family)
MNAEEDISPRVNQLLQICKQRTVGYKYIAENIKDLQLQTIFDQYSRQAATFAKQLTPYIEIESAHQQGEINSDLIKELNEAIEQRNALAILNASIREESNAINSYEEILNEKLAADLVIILKNQLEKVRASQNNFQLYLQCLKNINLN